MATFAIRTLRKVDGANAHPGMWWVSVLGDEEPFRFLGHGGWVYFDPLRPLVTFAWWRRHAITVPRQRGWRWD